MFSLCIPTIDRYNTFLKEYIPKYLSNDLISEIIITDENGNDVDLIKQHLINDKLKLYKNDKKLGPFLNKLKACKLANNEWIVLMDSDNFADYDYFLLANNYINNNNLKKETILSPSFAKPQFNYTSLNNKILNKQNMFKYYQDHKCLLTLMNTGNYIINKYLIDNINISNDIEIIQKSSACDVILFNTILLEQYNIDIHIIENMHYLHVVHPDSTYLTTSSHYPHINNYVHTRFLNYIRNSS
jgi:hypothetical protein